jgi:hypothetical protein
METERLFEEIANSNKDPFARASMVLLNDQMRAIRPYEAAFIPDRDVELAALAESWEQRDMSKLRILLSAYFERRQALVPKLVHLINRPN